MSIFAKTITQINKLVREKKVSSKEIFEYFQKRIKKYNHDLNAYLTVTENFTANSTNTGLLTGIPLAVKDNFCIKGVRATASAKVLDDFIAPYESTVTSRLKKSGYSLLGKTNMDAWAHGSSTETSDYGPTLNPWDKTRSPGGSSGGSASAVASFMAPAAIGSETAGSIRQPASWSGLVGLKPTYGRTSRYGVIAMGSSLDCPGPLTRSVYDAALLLQVIAGRDPYDATSANAPIPDYLKEISSTKKLTIGVTQEYFEGVNEQVKQTVLRALDIFKKQGHTIKNIKLISPKYAISVYTIIQRAEVSSNLARYDGIRYADNRLAFGAEAKRRSMLGAYTLSYGYYDAYYKKAQKVRTLLIDDFRSVFHDVDVIVAPTTPSTAIKLGEFEKYSFFGELMDVLAEPAAMAGIPAINIPVGLDKMGLPIGMQIMGNYFCEATIMNLAYQFEKETDYFGIMNSLLKKYED